MAKVPVFTKLVEHAPPLQSPTPPTLTREPRVPGIPRVTIAEFARRKGRDNFTFSMPAGLEYDGHSAIALPPSSDAAAVRVWNVTADGAGAHGAGEYTITVAWSAPHGGTIRYRLRAYGSPPVDPAAGGSKPDEIEHITIVDKESTERLRNLLRGGAHTMVTFQGADALAMVTAGITDILESGEIFAGNVIAVDDLLIIAVLVLGSVALAALTVICVVGIATGYTVSVKEFNLGNVFQGQLPKLVLELVPPAS